MRTVGQRDMAKQKSKGAGGKLARSEIIQARLSPKIKFAAEILARRENRTLSSLIEKLIDHESDARWVKLQKMGVDVIQECTMGDLVTRIWHSDEMIRFVGFALTMQELLTDEEQKMWNLISDTPYFWECVQVIVVDEKNHEIGREWEPVYSINGFISENLREYWVSIKNGELTRKDLPSQNRIGKKIVYADKKNIPRKMHFMQRLNYLSQINNRQPDENVSDAVDSLRKYENSETEKNHTLFDRKNMDACLDFFIRYAKAKSHDN